MRSPNPDKAIRGALMVARRKRADGGDLPVPPDLVYHGSPQTSLNTISASPPSRQYDNATSQFGAYFAPHRHGAEHYAGRSGRVYEAKYPAKNPYNMPASEWSYYQDITRGPRDEDGFRGKPIPSEKWGDRQRELIKEAIARRQELEAAGHDGIILRGPKGDIKEMSSFNDAPITRGTGGRLARALGGSLSDAINSFSQERNARLTRPAAGSDAATQLALAELQAQRPQLAIAEPEEERRGPSSIGQAADLGAEIDQGAKWLSGKSDDETAPVKGGTTQKAGSLSSGPTNSGQLNSRPTHLGGPAHSSGDDPLPTIVAGIRHLETGGLKDPYHYVSPAGALGAYGVMPGTLAAWTKGTKYEGISPREYLGSPSIQDDVATLGARNYYNQYNGNVGAVGQAWLGGPGSVGKPSKDPYTGISTDQYGSNLTNFVNNNYQPQIKNAQAAPSTAPPPAQLNDAAAGQQAQADPMSNIYNRIAFAPDVQAGYDSPQVMFDPDQSQAKRGGSMRRRHFDDGGDAGGDGGDGGDGGGGDAGFGGDAGTAAGMAAANAAAANAAAGWGGGQGVTAQGAAAGYGGVGMGSPAGAPAGTSTTGTGSFGGMGGDTGFGSPSSGGSSVGFGSPGADNSGYGSPGVGNSGFGSGPGVSTAAAMGHGGPGGAAGPGGTGGGAGTAAGGSGFGTFGSGLGFGLGQSGRGNTAAANSNTALTDALQNTQMRYGFVNGNDPGLANSQTGQLALNQFSSPQALRAFAQTVSNPGYAQAIGYSPSQIAALNAQLAALEGGAGGGSGGTPASQGFSNVGYGGGSPSQSVGGFGGNTTATGAEGVNTAALSPQQFSSPQAQQQYNQALAFADAEQKGYSPSQIQAINAVNRTGMPSPGQFSSPQAAQQFAAAAQQKASGAPQERNGKAQNGGRIEHRSNGGLASIPTDQLIDLALNKIRQRKNRAGGGSSNADNLAQIASYNPRGAAALSKMNTVSAIDGVNPNGTPNVIQVPNYFYGMSTDTNSSPTASASPAATNTPAIPSGQVGNHANSATGSPIGGVPIATPTVGPIGSTDPSGPQYNNTLDQVLGTNSPTMDQIFGFTYPTVPSPKPQPVGPVPQSLINNLYGFSDGSQTGTGSQFFQSGGAVIMDALNRARMATKGKFNV